ncbi:hypothetical protein [Chamaesiphon sp.]|uniref:hypothetical protein n=1 Tax=Chamaesiphon sp. TaxID=2814140 RepID=UPI0035948929
MTQTNESKTRSRHLDRQFRVLERRLTRLEDTQLTGREVNFSIDNVYDEIDALEDQMNQRFDRLESQIDLLAARIEERFNQLERKLDLAISTSQERRMGGD